VGMAEQLHSIDDVLNKHTFRFALFHLGFRPFFLGAMVFAVVSMLIWLLLFVPVGSSSLVGLSPRDWHAHEMVYGYAVAVIAGFLLTAIRNWTGIQTAHGLTLFVLFSLWLVARLMPFIPLEDNLRLMASLDLLFMLALLLATVIPIAKVKQWNQLGIIGIVVLLLCGNLLFYLGVLNMLQQGVEWGLYTGLYVVLALIFIIGRRVIPFFIEKGIGGSVEVKNWRWLDVTNMTLFITFAILDVFTGYAAVVAGLALLLFIINCIRLFGWYAPGLVGKPLLWVLYLAYMFIVAGFAMKVIGFVYGLPASAHVHLFTVGGIGLMTTGMMARVTLGHTGRNVFEPPKILIAIFVMLLMSAFSRVFLPLLLPQQYLHWVQLSQLLWLTAFLFLLWMYLPMLIKPRVDGRYG
jgi:uncharacterized protein involved in response to NO